MGYDLYREVLAHAPADLTPAERLVLAVIADKANDKTRECWPSIDLLSHLTGIRPDSLRRVFQRLRDRPGGNLDPRVALGKDRTGRPVYAFEGTATTYRLPRFELRPLPAKAKRRDESPATDAFKRGDESPATQRRGGTVVTQRRDRGDTEGGLSSRPSPHEPSGNPHSGRASEPRHIVMQNTDAKPSEADAVVGRIEKEINPKSMAGLLVHMARGGELQKRVNDVRAAGLNADAKDSNDRRKRMPPCPHGDPGGDQPNPKGGEPWCVWCRRDRRATRLNDTVRTS